jgi:sec-independent protein translocase protein TatC
MAPPAEFEHTRMTLGEHFAELRSRLLKGLVAVVVAFVVAWAFHGPISDVVMRPFHEAIPRINDHNADRYAAKVEEGSDPLEYFTTTDPKTWELLPEYRAIDRPTALSFTEGYAFLLRISLYAALLLGGPVLLWQLWQFIAAGLYPKERRAAMRYFPYSVVLFLLGVLFGYFLLIPYAMYFLGIAFDTEKLAPQYRLADYFSLLTSLTLALAIVFQLPVLMTFGARLGLVTPQQMSRYRGYFIIGAFVLAAILTPPDPVTQCMMAVPILLLYEIGLVSARVFARPRMQPPIDPRPSPAP